MHLRCSQRNWVPPYLETTQQLCPASENRTPVGRAGKAGGIRGCASAGTLRPCRLLMLPSRGLGASIYMLKCASFYKVLSFFAFIM